MFGMHLTHCLYPNLFGQVRVHRRSAAACVLHSDVRAQSEWELFTGELVVPENSQVGAVPPRSSSVGSRVPQRCAAQRSSPPAWVPADRVTGEGAAGAVLLHTGRSCVVGNRLLRLRGNVPGA
jgi:hypothetical protein